jgi:excisionase family DNA binding protein
MHFTPPQIAKYFDVNESTIKRWILSGKLKADETPGGHYRVSKEQMQGFLAKHDKYASSSYVLSRLLKQKKNENLDWRVYYDSLYTNNLKKSISILRVLYLSGHSLANIFDKIIIPTLKNIGIEWTQGRLEINMEHRMSFLVAQHLSILADFSPELSKKNFPGAILACVPGNTHILPMFMGDALLRQYNFKREVLGINIAAEEIEKALSRSNNIKLVCIAKTYSPVDSKEYLKKIISLAKEHKIFLVITGLGWNAKELAIAKKEKIILITSLVDFENYLKTLV